MPEMQVEFMRYSLFLQGVQDFGSFKHAFEANFESDQKCAEIPADKRIHLGLPSRIDSVH